MLTSKTATDETETRVKCSKLEQKGARAGLPCRTWADPGSDRCRFHPHSKDEVAQAQSEGGTALPLTSVGAINHLAKVDAETAFHSDEIGATDDPDVGTAAIPGASVTEVDSRDASDDVEDGFIKMLVLDPDKNDYVEKTVRVDSIRESASDSGARDGFELGHEYRSGFAARFDYRWSNNRDDINRLDAAQGYVPQRESLDNRHVLKAGVVTQGDLILMKRPKEVTERRGIELARQQAEQQGRELGALGEEARDVARKAGVDHIPTFGGVTESRGQFATEEDPERTERRVGRLEPDLNRLRGRTSFAFPNNPLASGKDNTRAAVGG